MIKADKGTVTIEGNVIRILVEFGGIAEDMVAAIAEGDEKCTDKTVELVMRAAAIGVLMATGDGYDNDDDTSTLLEGCIKRIKAAEAARQTEKVLH